MTDTTDPPSEETRRALKWIGDNFLRPLQQDLRTQLADRIGRLEEEVADQRIGKRELFAGLAMCGGISSDWHLAIINELKDADDPVEVSDAEFARGCIRFADALILALKETE